MVKFDNHIREAGHKSIDDLLIAELDAFKRSFFERVVL